MKKLIISLCFLLCTKTAMATNPFIGTWQLEQGEYLNAEGQLVQYSTLGIKSQKVINESHFSFVSTANGKFWAAGSGLYRVEQNQYFETLDFASFPLEHNGTYPFQFKMDGNLWHNERFKDGKRVEYEVWRKLE